MTILSTDSFDRADSTTSPGATDGAGTLDPLTWVERTGAWGISSNQAFTNSAVLRSVATVNLGVSDIDIQVTLAVLGSAGLTFRFSDTSNLWWVRNNAGTLELTERNGGVQNVRGSAAGLTAGDTIRVVANGDDIECFRNGVSQFTYNSSFNNTATHHGLFNNNDTTARLDNWSASDVSLNPTESISDTVGITASFSFHVSAHYVSLSDTTGITASLSAVSSHVANQTDTVGITAILTVEQGSLTYFDQVMADSPLIYYEVNEASGTTAIDSSGNSNDGTYVGSPTFSQTPYGELDGTAITLGTGNSTGLGRINIPTAAFDPSAGDWTFEAFINISSNLDTFWNSDIFIVRDGVHYMFFNAVDANSTGSGPGIYIYTSHGGNRLFLPYFNDHAWHHLVVVYDDAANTFEVFIDASSLGAQTAGNAVNSAWSPLTVFTVGGDTEGTANSFKGKVDEIAIYTSKLSPARIEAHFAAAGPIPDPPTISSVSPTSGTTAGGTSVAIVGTNLDAVTSVRFGTTSASFIINNSTSITATSPAHAAGLVDITASSPGGTSATGSSEFTYTGTPTITSVTPTSGTTAGGTSVSISGTNLSGATAVVFGSTAAASYVVNSSILITATSPAHAAGLVDIRVTTPGGTSAITGADQFTFITVATASITDTVGVTASLSIDMVLLPNPLISLISPDSGPVAGGTNVEILGSRFTNASAVKFGTVNAASFVINSDVSLTAVTPAHAAGPVNVTVTNPAGVSLPEVFTFNELPAVTSAVPSSGTTAGGTSVAINGSQFTGATAVYFGATPATSFVVNSDILITAVAPPHPPGTVAVRVTTPSGTNP